MDDWLNAWNTDLLSPTHLPPMMKPFPNLERAPITEAIVDLRVDAPDLTMEKIAGVHDVVREAFPQKQDRIEYEFGLALSGSASAVQRKEKHLGWLAWSADRTRAMQARLDGFTFSRLPQYRDWDELRTEARRAWMAYSEAVKPRSVKRLAVRYVNRIELPQPVKSLGDYFETFPRIGPTLPQVLAGVYVRLLIPFESAVASVTYAIDVSGMTESVVPVVLDIDVFREADLEPQSDDVWAALEELRHIKNMVFFGSITKKLEEMFK